MSVRLCGFNCWISFALVFSCMYCWVLIFDWSPFLSWFICTMIHGQVRDLSCKPNIYVSWPTSELRVRLVLWNLLKPSSNFLTDPSKAVLICYLYLSLPYCHVCFLQLWDWPLGSLVCYVFYCFYHFHIRCAGSCVVLDCIDSWSLPSVLLSQMLIQNIWENSKPIITFQIIDWDLIKYFAKCMRLNKFW